MRPLSFLSFVACSESEVAFQDVPEPLEGESTLSGRVCDPKTQTWVEGALVYTNLTDAEGVVLESRSATTDADGHWTLQELPDEVRYGVWVQYRNEMLDYFVVDIPDGENVSLPDPFCFGGSSSAVAVITGGWDDLSTLLPTFGFSDITVINGQSGDDLVEFLSAPEALAAYETIFFDGGTLEKDIFYGTDPVVATVTANVAGYVEGGGRLFASDWAYDVIEQVWPNQVDFFGDDAVPDAAQVGEPAPKVVASLTNGDLLAAAGGSEVDVAYDVPVWPLITTANDGVDVLMIGDAPYREGFDVYEQAGAPLAVRFFKGDGEVVFTTWRIAANATGPVGSVAGALVAGGF
jgi:hypothetical protein